MRRGLNISISQKILSILLSINILLVFVNFSVNGHYHKTVDGQIIYHSHFSVDDDNGNDDSPFGQHSHTQEEFLRFDKISHPFFILSLIYVILALLFPIIKRYFKREFSNYQTPDFYLYFHLRAPPALLS
jgi:hypothetical protein